MERHKCKLCFKSFSNGRALGGHMRSHMLNLAIPTKHEDQQDQEHEPQITEFASSSDTSSEDDDRNEDVEGEDFDEDKGGSYGLRENPKRSIRLVDHEFSFGVDGGSVVLQDRESETESSKNPTRRRSKRARKLLEYQYDRQQRQQLDNRKFITKSDSAEPEPLSSVSDTTTEEDVAFCLMMLSRDKWKKKENQKQSFQVEEFEEEDDEEEEAEETDESEEYIKTIKNNNNNNNSRSSTKGNNKYKCETCNKVFKSYQALGGHRASHKKLKLQAQVQEREYLELETVNVVAEKKVHECPYCCRVFSSGQALGGHKRSHVIGVAATNVTTGKTSARVSSKLGDTLSFIDLNLPAPVEDDDLSAVSDAEFVNHNQIKR